MQLRSGNVPEAEKSFWEIPTNQLGQFPDFLYLFFFFFLFFSMQRLGSKFQQLRDDKDEPPKKKKKICPVS